MTALYCPPRFERQEILDAVNLASRVGRKHRRRIALEHPLHFALIYMRHALTEDGILSINDVHVQMAEDAKNWMYRWPVGREFRRAWIAPRDAGKSTWMFRILPLWAAAGGWRTYIAMFQDSGSKASDHFQNLRNELRTNDLLRNDFPGLCTPSEKWAGDRTSLYISAAGHIFESNGFGSSFLGMNKLGRRPDLVMLDDIEPTGAKYSDDGPAQRLQMLEEAVFPLGHSAVINIVGTVTKQRSIMHQLALDAQGVETADWIRRHKFVPFYFPGIITEPDGTERSYWPTKFPLEGWQGRRHDTDWQLNYMNDPEAVPGNYWTRKDIVPLPDDKKTGLAVLVVDPANSVGSKSDDTGVSIVYSVGDGFPAKEVYVEYAEGFRIKPEQLKEKIRDLIASRPDIAHIIVEETGKGHWLDLGDMPRQVKTFNSHRSKKARIAHTFPLYQQGKVYQKPGLVKLEHQQFLFCMERELLRDDVIDAATMGIDYMMTGSAE